MLSRDEIIRMARKANIAKYGLGFTAWEGQLERFAELVAACEREACAKVCEGFPANRDWVPGSLWGNIRSEMSAAIRARAAIAKATGEQA